MAPFVSIILPVYNAKPFLTDCLDRLAAQTFKDFEIIAIDDGSTDTSLDILKAYQAHEPRLHVFTQKNGGPGAARNTGLDHAQGRYITFLDPDDSYSVHFLKRLCNAAKKNSLDLVVCRSSTNDEKTNEKTIAWWTIVSDFLPYKKNVFSAGDIASHAFQIFVGWPWDKLIKRELVINNSLRYPALRNSEDGVFIFLAVCLSQRIGIVDDVLVHHLNDRAGSVSNSRSSQPEGFFAAIELIKGLLCEYGIYPKFEQSFQNWALHYCLWNLHTAHSMDRPAIYTVIKNEALTKLCLLDYNSDFYYAPNEHSEMCWVANHELDEYLEFRAAVSVFEDCSNYYQRALDCVYRSETYRVGDFFMRIPRTIKSRLLSTKE